MSSLKRGLRMLGPALLVFAAAWALVASCLGGSADRELWVQVSDDGGEPLAEVPVHAGGRLLGATDAQGRLRTLGMSAGVLARCPEAYRPLPPQRAKDAVGATLTFVCRPRLRTIALVVHAPAARGLTLRADDQGLGRVDEHGLLHAVVRRAPGTKVSLSLAERGSPPLAQRELLVEDRDRVVLFEP